MRTRPNLGSSPFTAMSTAHAIEALRLYGQWTLGEYQEIGGYIPVINETRLNPSKGPWISDQGMTHTGWLIRLA